MDKALIDEVETNADEDTQMYVLNIAKLLEFIEAGGYE